MSIYYGKLILALRAVGGACFDRDVADAMLCMSNGKPYPGPYNNLGLVVSKMPKIIQHQQCRSCGIIRD